MPDCKAEATASYGRDCFECSDDPGSARANVFTHDGRNEPITIMEGHEKRAWQG